MSLVKDGPTSASCGDVKEEATDCHKYKGVSVLRIPARDAYAYGLQLLDVFFF